MFYPNAGQRLVNVVGANGIAFNYPAEQYTYAFGYPGYPSLSKFAKGERLYYCSGTPTWNGIFDPKRMALKCDFASYAYSSYQGGPWVMEFDGELGYGYLHSITSTYSGGVSLMGYCSETPKRISTTPSRCVTNGHGRPSDSCLRTIFPKGIRGTS